MTSLNLTALNQITRYGLLNGDWSPTGIWTFANTGLHLLDTNASHDLIISPGSDLTADRTLSLVTGDAARTITLSGNPTLGDWFNQSVKTTASPTHVNLLLSGGKIYPTSDSTTAIQITKADGATVVLNVDTTNARLGIGGTPDFPLTVIGPTGTANQAQFAVRSRYFGLDNVALSAYLTNSAGGSLYFAQISFTNVVRTAGSETGSVNFTMQNAGTWAKRVVFYGDKMGVNILVPTSILHIVSSAATNIGQIIKLAAGQTANAFEVQNSVAAIRRALNAVGVDLLMADQTSDVAPNDDTTLKKLSLQRLAAPPTNGAYIAFANNPGATVFYLVLEEG